jgi:NAD+ diphosphatase
VAEHPSTAYPHCPKCGVGGFTSTGGNRLWCASCDFAWYFNVAAAVDVIIRNATGEILMTRRAREPHKGKLDLPGGFVDSGESLEEAARREVLEEVGFVLQDLTYLGSFPNDYAFGGVIYHALDVVMTAEVNTGALSIGDDVASARFMSPHAIDLSDVGLDSTRAALRRYLSKL